MRKRKGKKTEKENCRTHRKARKVKEKENEE